MNDSNLFKIIALKTEKKLAWKKVPLWTDSEYRRLSHLIHKDTGISISPQTLKRLFGKVRYKDTYTPQPATKDALARFLNYEDWDVFARAQASAGSRFSHLMGEWRGIFRQVGWWMPLTLVILLLTALLFIFPGNNRGPVTFYAEKLSGLTPHTVSLHYDISKMKGRDVYIDFDIAEEEENSPGELLDQSRNLINHCYESPGFFNVTVSSGDNILSSAKIHVLSDGWASYCFYNDNFRSRKFIFGLENKTRDTIDDGLLYIPPRELNDQGFQGNTVYYLEHMLFRNFHLSADSCTLEVRYRNSPDMGGISCFDTEFRLTGENGLASVMLVQEGCYRWSEITVGEKHMNGKYDNLAFLSADLSGWNIFRMEIENGRAVFSNAGDSIFSCEYSRPLGEIKGIRLVTKGSGAFDYIAIYDAEEHLVFRDDF